MCLLQQETADAVEIIVGQSAGFHESGAHFGQGGSIGAQTVQKLHELIRTAGAAVPTGKRGKFIVQTEVVPGYAEHGAEDIEPGPGAVDPAPAMADHGVEIFLGEKPITLTV